MTANVELHISQRDYRGAASLIGANLVLTAIVISAVAIAGHPVTSREVTDIVFEGAGAAVALLIFVAAALVTTKAIPMRLLLTGLFVFQLGRTLDLADEIVYFGFAFWSVAGDALTLLGEILLTVVAFSFVRLASRVVNADALTGLSNRAAHVRALDAALARPDDEPVAVVAFDLDNFKYINDTFGHGYGDEVLVHTADLLRANTGRGERVARTGGEEFEVMLTGKGPDGVIEVAERIRHALESNPPEKLERLTASIGVAIARPGESAEAVRARADGAAYEAKQAGRNRVVLAD